MITRGIKRTGGPITWFTRAAATGAFALAAPAGSGVPDFIPTGSGMFSDFTALDEPRSEVPVGALWVQGFGPHGPPAPADNIETVRSVIGYTMDRNLQLRLTLGIASFLDLDPGLRNHITARFSDLSIVRVKDPSRLSGPTGEPRIYEALKAATITVTSGSDVGLDLNGRIAGKLPILGRGDTGRVRTLTIDGRDMFIAYRIVTPKVVEGKSADARLGKAGVTRLAILGYEVTADPSAAGECLCAARTPEQASACAPQSNVSLTLRKAGAASADKGVTVAPAGAGELGTELPVPVSDGRGGLFTSLSFSIELDPEQRGGSDEEAKQCGWTIGRRARLAAAPRGTRLETLGDPKAAGWQ